MYHRSSTEEDITPQIVCKAPWRVTQVKPLDNFMFAVEFVDGVKGHVMMKNLIVNPKSGVFTKLKDTKIFNQIFVEYGVVTWPGEIDLAPDAMHDEIKKNGQWVLT